MFRLLNYWKGRGSTGRKGTGWTFLWCFLTSTVWFVHCPLSLFSVQIHFFPSHQRSAGIDFVFLTVESMLLKIFFFFDCAGLYYAGFSVQGEQVLVTLFTLLFDNPNFGRLARFKRIVLSSFLRPS